jgi:RHS repeat-associated protein
MSTGLWKRYEYDVFGTPHEGEMNRGMNLGYTGKLYDTVTGLYNYGYRDYAPETVRFTTVDPVRDGANWFAYVNNDPVNWVDLWGLSAKDTKTIYSELTFSLPNETNKNTLASEIGQFLADVFSPLGDKASNAAGDFFESLISIFTESHPVGQHGTSVYMNLSSLGDLFDNKPISIYMGVIYSGGQTSIDMQFPIIGISFGISFPIK